MTTQAPAVSAKTGPAFGREIALVLMRELVRSLRSAKGIVLALITVVGGVGTTMIGLYVQAKVYQRTGTAQGQLIREEALKFAYDDAIARSLAESPEVMFAMFSTTLTTSALLAAFVGYDAISTELQYRGIRYSTVRARRDSFVIGKLLGTFAVASLMTLVIHTISWLLMLVYGGGPPHIVLSWGPRLWILTLPISMAWCALVTFASSLVKTPILALLSSLLAMLVTWICYGVGRAFKDYGWLSWVHPGGFDRLLLSPEPLELAKGLVAAFGFAAVFLAGAVFVTTKRDV